MVINRGQINIINIYNLKIINSRQLYKDYFNKLLI